MQRNAIEPILGALVLVAAIAFLVFAYNKAGHHSYNGYPLTARFSSVDGLENGGDVRIGGVRVGQVTDIAVDPKTYLAVVTLSVTPEIKVPVDSVASVSTEGLLGGKYIGLEPGDSDKMLTAGALITHTQAAVSLENLIGQFMYSGSSSSGGSGSSKGSQSAGDAGSANGPANQPTHP